MKPPTQIVSVKGTRYECGYQHGEQAGILIRRNINYYLDWWQYNLGFSKQDIYARADSIIKITEKYDAGLVAEMKGIADAALVDFEAVVSLNSRYELAWASPSQLLEGCTSISALPRATESEDTLLAQNWDYRLDVTDSCIILKVKVDSGPTVIMHTEAGIIGQKGLNSEGVGIVINAMVSDIDRLGESIPFFLVCRKMLDSPSFSGAVKALLEAKRRLSYNVMLAGEGVLVDLEAHPLDVSIIYPENARMVHTNHFVGDRALKVKDNYVIKEPSSINRYVLAREKLMAHDNHNVESFKKILRNHYDYPTSICYHANLEIHTGRQNETVSSVIILPEKRVFMYTQGPPCCNPYVYVPF